MSVIKGNLAVFSTVSRQWWSTRTGLLPEERFLIETYLDREKKTLEAGTAGGRILLEMRTLGFTSLYGFDYVPELIEAAKKRDLIGSIQFEVGNAVSLAYTDAFFDQVVYLQQVLCFIDDDALRLNAIREAYRILKPGGTALISLLSYDARKQSPLYGAYLSYLWLMRTLRRSKRPIQYLPWLKLAGKVNWGALADRGPYVYWYETREVIQQLKLAGFQIAAAGSNRQIEQQHMHKSTEDLFKKPIEGMLYFVCHKPAM